MPSLAIGFFLVIKITAVRQVRMSLQLLLSEREDKTCFKCHMAREDVCMHWFCFCFCVHGRQNPKTPKLSPMADDSITQGSIGGLGSLVYICDFDSVTDC